ncbi:MAG TPA: sensor histidine kinase [Streptosporangiaceae bacterium]|nr:sensor histidine kinase [Streptosporangiaceae bacterium]
MAPSSQQGLDPVWEQELGSKPGRAMRWLFSAVWLVYLIQPLYSEFDHDHSLSRRLGALALVVAFCLAYAPVVAYASEPTRLVRCGMGAVMVIATLACVFYGSDWVVLWVYVSAASGYVLSGSPGRRRLLFGTLAGIVALFSLLAYTSHAGVEGYLLVLIPVMFIGPAMAGFRFQAELVRQLAAARGTVAKLAASEERLRLARDMHDLTGQSLSTITLKADLAARRLQRLPQDEQTLAVGRELSDIAQVSRQTLHDIRDAVSGYRRPTLAVEMITAREALQAAGVALHEDPALITVSGSLDPDAEAALAWCLREAVTNVVRHSRAKTCRVTLVATKAELSLEVTDDGHGLSQSPAKGNGLHSMSERLAALGGRLTLAPGDPGLSLTAAVPA